MGKINGGGHRPKKIIDLAMVEKLAALDCTDIEIGYVLDISHDTILRRKKQDKAFAYAIEKGKAHGDMSIRRAMFKKAIEFMDTGMLVWLSKNRLGYTDRHDMKVDHTHTVIHSLPDDILWKVVKSNGQFKIDPAKLGVEDQPHRDN